jgi:ferredoxin
VKVVVQWSLCDGNGVCAVEAPELFELNENDELVVLKEQFGEALRAQAEAAVRVCPKRALSIER